jgi:hypothetical protein
VKEGKVMNDEMKFAVVALAIPALMTFVLLVCLAFGV